MKILKKYLYQQPKLEELAYSGSHVLLGKQLQRPPSSIVRIPNLALTWLVRLASRRRPFIKLTRSGFADYCKSSREFSFCQCCWMIGSNNRQFDISSIQQVDRGLEKKTKKKKKKKKKKELWKPFLKPGVTSSSPRIVSPALTAQGPDSCRFFKGQLYYRGSIGRLTRMQTAKFERVATVVADCLYCHFDQDTHTFLADDMKGLSTADTNQNAETNKHKIHVHETAGVTDPCCFHVYTLPEKRKQLLQCCSSAALSDSSGFTLTMMFSKALDRHC